MTEPIPRDVVVVGGGVAGLAAAVFTARHGRDTLVLDDGESILRRNAHLENVPGFPAGLDARRFLDLLGEQSERAGADRDTATVTDVSLMPVVARETADDGATGVEEIDAHDDTNDTIDVAAPRFEVQTASGDSYHAVTVVAATKNEVGYLRDIEGLGVLDRGKSFVDVDERGRTGVTGLYAAGRLAEKPHQAAVCAGHGAEVAVTLLEDADDPFYHDWVAPNGYFTDRGRDLPPGCEEIDDAERQRRESQSRQLMRERFDDPPAEPPETHPSLVE